MRETKATIVLENAVNIPLRKLLRSLQIGGNLIAPAIDRARKEDSEIDLVGFVEIMPGEAAENRFFIEYVPQPGTGLLLPNAVGFRNVRFHGEYAQGYRSNVTREDYAGFTENLGAYLRDHTLIIVGTRKRGEDIRRILRAINPHTQINEI